MSVTKKVGIEETLHEMQIQQLQPPQPQPQPQLPPQLQSQPLPQPTQQQHLQQQLAPYQMQLQMQQQQHLHHHHHHQQQLSFGAPMTEAEAGSLLEVALVSLDPFPINLEWLVPLLHYKHISSLTTHLKRHFLKEKDYKKVNAGGGARAYTYQISIRCFKKICTKARHASRKSVALYWIKMVDKKAPHCEGDEDEGEPKKRKYTKKRLPTNTPGEGPVTGASLSSSFDEDNEDLDVEEDDDEDYIEYHVPSAVHANNNSSNNNNNSNNKGNNMDVDSDVEIDSSSSSFLRSLRAHQPTSQPSQPPPQLTPQHQYHPQPQQSPIPASTSLSIISATPPASTVANTLPLRPPSSAPPQYQPRLPPPLLTATSATTTSAKRDFPNVSILARKRKQQGNSQPTNSAKKDKKDAQEPPFNKERVSSTRNNLRMLSQLALGLR